MLNHEDVPMTARPVAENTPPLHGFDSQIDYAGRDEITDEKTGVQYQVWDYSPIIGDGPPYIPFPYTVSVATDTKKVAYF